MKNLINKIFDIRKGELLVTLLMLLYIYLVMVTYYFLKPARDSLFLSEIGWRQLPYVFMLIALVAIPVNALYSRAGRRLRMNKLINYTTIALIACLFILRWVVSTGSTWAMYTFYIWVSIYGVLSTSQFWLFANAVYTPTQAKRLFVLLNLGAIIGAFTGGEVTGLIIKLFDVRTENLLFFCMAFLTICIFVINAVWALKKKEIEETAVRSKVQEQRKESVMQIFRSIKKSRYLLMIVGIIGMTMATGTFVDTQFKGVTEGHFINVEGNPEEFTDVEKGEMTSFLGKFYGRLSLISLLLQILFTYRFIRILGATGIIAFLPFGLLLGSVTMLAWPGLLAGVLLRGSDGSFKYSLDKTGRELLFLPVPLEVKKRTKVFIDVVVDRANRGFAGGLLLLCIAAGFDIRQLSVVVIMLLAIWLTLVFFIRKEYVNAFRQALEKREIDLDELRTNIDDVTVIRHLTEALKSGSDRLVVYALGMLQSVQDTDITEDVKPLLGHKSPEIRLLCLKTLQNQLKKSYVAETEDLVFDPDPDVQVEALHYSCRFNETGRLALLDKYLGHDDPAVAAAAAVCIAEHGSDKEKKLLSEQVLEKLLSAENGARDICRSQAAKTMGALNRPEFRRYLKELMNDQSRCVVVKAIEAAGRTQDREFVQPLFQRLSDKKYRKYARSALAAYGEKVLGTMGDYLTDSSVPILLRRNIPAILSGIPSQITVDLLTAALEKVEPSLKYYLIKALNKIRKNYPGLKIKEKNIDTLLIKQTRQYYETLNILGVQENIPDSPELRLLKRALRERLDRNMEEMFRLLGLRYPPKDIFSAYLGITSDKKGIRASAVEFLDNVLSNNLKKYLLPIIDPEAADSAASQGKRLFDLKISTVDEAYEALIKDGNPWIRTCAVFSVSQGRSLRIEQLVKDARNDTDPIVRETAGLVVKREKITD